MDWSPSTLSDPPFGVSRLTGSPATVEASRFARLWSDPVQPLPDLLLVLASTRTAEQQGISAAGCTPAARRTTALAFSAAAVTRRSNCGPFSAAAAAAFAAAAFAVWS